MVTANAKGPKARTSAQAYRFRENVVKYFSVVTILLLVVGLSIKDGNFVGKLNVTNLLRDTAPLMIMSVGMTSVLIFGSIDLSMGAACSVSNVLFVKFLAGYGASFVERFGQDQGVALATACAFAISLGFGLLSGFLLGLVHVKLKVPSFIASLGFMSLWQSTALLIAEAPISVPKAMWGAVDWFKVSLGWVGLPLIIALLIAVLLYVFQGYTALGKTVYAIGGNERAARVSGTPVDKTKIMVFTLNGAMAALGGVFLAAKLRSCAPTVGDPFTLLIVASCVLGGTSLAGGRGSVLGTILGVFTVAIINNGMNFINVSAYWQNVVFGIFILGAIAVSVDRSTRGFIIK